MLVEYNLPTKINMTFLSILKTMRHGSFALVHSVVNKIWYQNTNIKHTYSLVSGHRRAQMVDSYT